MKFIDFIYYLSYKAYVRGNKEPLGAFFISTLWVSSLQFLWILTIMISIELYLKEMIFSFIDKPYNFAIFLVFMVIVNNIYLNFGNRKKRILTRFNISEKKRKLFWIMLIVFFFVSFILVGSMSFLKKEMFGW